MASFADSISLDWLEGDACSRDVVVSSRARLARNLAAQPFPHAADSEQLLQVRDQIIGAAQGLRWLNGIDESERSYLLRCRLLSPEFQPSAPGRALGLAIGMNASVMVNEEDHIRAQAIVAGWDPTRVESQARKVVQAIETKLRFAFDQRVGFIAASPANAGVGTRISAMFHLVGLAHQGRLRNVLQALTDQNVMIRGIFGEGTRPIGAFFQVSMTRELHPEFSGACEYLIESERTARDSVSNVDLWNSVQQVVSKTISRRAISYEESLWACAWIRWAASRKLWGEQLSVATVDRWFIQIPLSDRNAVVDRMRATALRSFIEPIWMPNRSVTPSASR